VVNNFTNEEMVNKHLMYGLADGTMREAGCLHQEQFSVCVIPETSLSGRMH
jgi:hypothetical protein